MKILWRYCSWLFSAPLLLAAICFAVGNRAPTIISLWPFGIEMGLPIYMLALAPMVFGLLCGAAMQWFAALRHRVAAQRLGREVAALKSELARAQAAQAQAQAAAGAPAPPTGLLAGLLRKLP